MRRRWRDEEKKEQNILVQGSTRHASTACLVGVVSKPQEEMIDLLFTSDR